MNMTYFIIICFTILMPLFKIVTCVSVDAIATIEEFKNEEFRNDDGSGSYTYSFKTSNGIERQEMGSISKPLHTDDAELVVRGSYLYKGPDGVLYTVHYVADRNGFQPEGAHIKVPPPSGFRKPNAGAVINGLDKMHKPMQLGGLEEPNDVYYFPSAALASLVGSNLG